MRVSLIMIIGAVLGLSNVAEASLLHCNDGLKTIANLNEIDQHLVQSLNGRRHQSFQNTVDFRENFPDAIIWLESEAQAARTYLKWRKILERSLVILSLPVTMPLIGGAALAIKIEGWVDRRAQGPVLFKQKRVGQFGKVFEIYKLRTMRKDAEKLGPVFTLDRDPRITRVGQYLRRWKLDELPQLIVNVLLKGDMGLIGPRPLHYQHELECSQKPSWNLRNLVPPGLTGLGQVLRTDAKTTDEQYERLSHDLYYVRKVSLSEDLKILSETFASILHKKVTP